MPTTPLIICAPQIMPDTLASLFTAVNFTEIRAASVTNYAGTDVNVNFYVAHQGDTPEAFNRVVFNHRVRPSDRDIPYLLPELRGKMLPPGSQLWGVASVPEAAVLHVTGIEIT